MALRLTTNDARGMQALTGAGEGAAHVAGDGIHACNRRGRKGGREPPSYFNMVQWQRRPLYHNGNRLTGRADARLLRIRTSNSNRIIEAKLSSTQAQAHMLCYALCTLQKLV